MLFSNFLQREDIFLGLFLVTTALTTTTSPLEFPSLGANQRLNMRAGFASSSEMTVGSASCPSSWNWQKKWLKLNSSIWVIFNIRRFGTSLGPGCMRNSKNLTSQEVSKAKYIWLAFPTTTKDYFIQEQFSFILNFISLNFMSSGCHHFCSCMVWSSKYNLSKWGLFTYKSYSSLILIS